MICCRRYFQIHFLERTGDKPFPEPVMTAMVGDILGHNELNSYIVAAVIRALKFWSLRYDFAQWRLATFHLWVTRARCLGDLLVALRNAVIKCNCHVWPMIARQDIISSLFDLWGLSCQPGGYWCPGVVTPGHPQPLSWLRCLYIWLASTRVQA